MWPAKEPGAEMKPEAVGQNWKMKHQDSSGTRRESEASAEAQKRKYQHDDDGDNASGTGMESEALVGSKKGKYQDENETEELVFEELCKARKKPPQEQREQLAKGEVPKPHRENPGQEPRESAPGPWEQAVTDRKSGDSGSKCRKRSYCVEEYGENQPKGKYGKLVQSLGHGEHGKAPRPHVTLPDALKMKYCVDECSHAQTSQRYLHQPIIVDLRECPSPDGEERECSARKPCATPKKGGENLGGGRGHSLEPDPLGTQARISVDLDSRKLPYNKTPVPADQGKGRGTDQALEITGDMEKEIKNALGPGPQEEILSSGFKLQITRGDIQTLGNGQWLNDEVINFYMNLLAERNKRQGYPSIHVFNTFFFPKFKLGGFPSVKRWTRGINLFEKDLILIPIHCRVHWSLVVVDLRKWSIIYLDSMGQTGEAICESVFQYLQYESKTRRNVELNPFEWKQYSMTSEEIPQQQNENDCGVFTCKYADYIARDQPVTFSQQHMPIFRKRMVWEILHNRLL